LFGVNLALAMAFTLGLRSFNLVEHERRSWGFTGMALDLLTAPVYVAAAAAQLAGRPLSYVVTAKGSAATGDTWRSFRPHLVWLAVALGSIVAGMILDHDYPTLYFWMAVTVVTCAAPLVHIGLGSLTARAPSMFERFAPVVTRRRLGEALVGTGAITRAQLAALLDLQATTDGPRPRLGDLALEQGMVTHAQLSAGLLAARVTDDTPDLAELAA
jgi:hypothetical protein